MTDSQHPAKRARVAAAVAAREVSDAARDLVGTASHEVPAAERIRAVRRLRLLALEVLDRTVIAEVLAGASWEEVAEAMLLEPGTAYNRYAETVELWAHPERSAQRGPGEAGDPDVAGTAAVLDQWWDHHRDRSNPLASTDLTPVTGLLDKP